MRIQTSEQKRFPDWNSSDAGPKLPICKKCGSPFSPIDGGDFMAGWCFACECNYVYQHVMRAVRLFGRRATHRRLKAMAGRPTLEPVK